MSSIQSLCFKKALFGAVLMVMSAGCASSEALPPTEVAAGQEVQAKAAASTPSEAQTETQTETQAETHGGETEHGAGGLALAPVDGHDEPRPYDETRDAWADVDATTGAALEGGKSSIIVMGANWCHDSRALAAHFETPRFQTLLSEYYEYVYVDMGIRNRNLDIPESYGIDKVEGTPTIIILDPKGNVINLETAKTWRDAASRSEDAVYDEFAAYAIDGVYEAPNTAAKTDDEAEAAAAKTSAAKTPEAKIKDDITEGLADKVLPKAPVPAEPKSE